MQANTVIIRLYHLLKCSHHLKLTIHGHSTVNTTIKATFLTAVSILLVSYRTTTVELACILQLLLNRASEESLAALTGHGTVVKTGSTITTDHTGLRTVGGIHVAGDVWLLYKKKQQFNR